MSKFKLITVQKVEDIVVQIFRSRGRVRTNYHIPSGMSGKEFSLFKNRNLSVLTYLKALKHGSKTKETQTLSELPETDSLLTQSETPQGFSDYLQLQSIKLIGRKFRGN